MRLIYIAALFWKDEIGRNAKLLLTLTFKKMATQRDPGGHHFFVLNCAINNTPVFVSAVEAYGNRDDKNCSVF
jgi:hypothetical protein